AYLFLKTNPRAKGLNVQSAAPSPQPLDGTRELFRKKGGKDALKSPGTLRTAQMLRGRGGHLKK
ncbi:hypothetical protein KIL84_006056, partial [Mauremys mutica]